MRNPLLFQYESLFGKTGDGESKGRFPVVFSFSFYFLLFSLSLFLLSLFYLRPFVYLFLSLFLSFPGKVDIPTTGNHRKR